MRASQIQHQMALNTIYEFCRALDLQDWDSLRRCLAKNVESDYSSFRGTPPTSLTADDFVTLRRVGLSGLVTQHLTFNHLLTFERAQVSCRFDFAIHRWPKDKQDVRFFHSFGFYNVVLRRARHVPYGWALSSITQKVLRSIGHPELHGAARSRTERSRRKKMSDCEGFSPAASHI